MSDDTQGIRSAEALEASQQQCTEAASIKRDSTVGNNSRLTQFLLAQDLGDPDPYATVASQDESPAALQEFIQAEALLTRFTTPSSNFSERGVIKQFGEFEDMKLIGQGGMGRVYQARDSRSGTIIALKIMQRKLLNSEEAMKRFKRERTAARSIDHPNVVPVIDAGETDSRLWFSMEFVNGPNFCEVARNRPSHLQAAIYVQKIAVAVQYFHDKDIIHRDLKPANVLLDEFEEPRVTDFGLARIEGDGGEPITRPSSLLGAPQYMSPEQASCSHKLIGKQTDVYGIGTILHELLTGEPPTYRVEGDSGRAASSCGDVLRRVIHGELLPLRQYAGIADEIPAVLESICQKCLQRSPDQRFATAQELADQLASFIDSQFEEDIDIQRAKSSGEYLGELLEDYRNRLDLMARRLPVNIRRKVGASDITQNTFTDAFKGVENFRGKTKRQFHAWLRKMQQHNIQREIRRAATKEAGFPGDSAEGHSGFQPPSIDPSPSFWCMRDEEWEQVDAYLHMLTDLEREVTVMRYFKGLPITEISEKLGINYDAVAGRLKRAMAKLKEFAEEHASRTNA